MPLGSLIGSGQGLQARKFIEVLIREIDVPIVVDAGIGKPSHAAEAMEMLRDTKSFPLLQGVRGQAGVDLDAIADSMQRVSQLVTDFPMIAEMDINPFIAGAAAADARGGEGRVTRGAD